MNFAHGVMATIVSTTTTDDGLGNTTPTTVRYTWGPVAVAPRYATESTDPRVPPVIVGKTIYGPLTMRDEADEAVSFAIDSDDVIEIGLDKWQVDGGAGEWRNPFTGWAAGAEVPVTRASAA